MNIPTQFIRDECVRLEEICVSIFVRPTIHAERYTKSGFEDEKYGRLCLPAIQIAETGREKGNDFLCSFMQTEMLQPSHLVLHQLGAAVLVLVEHILLLAEELQHLLRLGIHARHQAVVQPLPHLRYLLRQLWDLRVWE